MAAIQVDLSTAAEKIGDATHAVAEMHRLTGDDRRAKARTALERVKEAAYWLTVVERELSAEVAR